MHQALYVVSRLFNDGGDTAEIDELLILSVEDFDHMESINEKVSMDEERENEATAGNAPFVLLTANVRDFDETPISTDEFRAAQEAEQLCHMASETVGKPGSQLAFNHMGFLVGQSRFDGSLQRVVQLTLRQGLLYLNHYPLTANQSGARRMYDTMHPQFYWPFLAS